MTRSGLTYRVMVLRGCRRAELVRVPVGRRRP